MRLWVVIALAMETACYSPAADAPCTIRCAQSGELCPGNLECGADGLCRAADGTCGPDVTHDANTADGDGTFCYGDPMGLRRICLAEPPTTDLSFATTPFLINTASHPLCVPHLVSSEPAGSDVCVIAARMILINPGITVKVVGPRPVVLLGTNGIVIRGTLDVSSGGSSDFPGAGGNPAACQAGSVPGNLGGGAGGSFGGRGGAGGTAGAGGGIAGPAITMIDSLRGGCAGQAGDGVPGAGGAGGGAAYLISSMVITVSGTINASGAGGDGGNGGGGGGGGGAGGLIGFAAPTLQATGAFLFANGGGGGCGGSNSATGGAGSLAPSPQVPAVGCRQNTAGATGGDGSAGNTTDGSPGASAGTTNGGGGGGGGGAGVLYVIPRSNLAHLDNANRSPTPRSN